MRKNAKVKSRYKDDNAPITVEWVFSNFSSMGAAYSARHHREYPNLIWQNRFERFVLFGAPQSHLKTRGDVRRLVAALGCPLALNDPPDPQARRFEWLDIN